MLSVLSGRPCCALGGVPSVRRPRKPPWQSAVHAPVVAMDVDDAGHIYTVAAFDPEGTVPDPDGGPFRSALFKICDVIGNTVELDAEALLLATFEGLKVESVAVRADEGELEIFIGTDDENYCGTIRPMPTPAQARPRMPPRWRSGLSPARRRCGAGAGTIRPRRPACHEHLS